MAKKLEDLGCVCVMPYENSYRYRIGIQTLMLEMIILNANVPVIVGTALNGIRYNKSL